MNKVLLIDTSGIFVPTVKVVDRMKMDKAKNKTDNFIMPPRAMYFNSLLSCMSKIGIDKDDIVIMAGEGKSFRKKYMGAYKDHRKGLRDKDSFTDWGYEFKQLNKLHDELNEATNWHFVRVANGLEADDVIAIACRVFKDKECVVVTGDCLNGNVKVRLSKGGSKCIRDIKIGEEVLSFDNKKKKFVVGKVINKFKKEHEKECLIYYDDYKQPIKSSLNHKFLTKNGWKKAINLKKNDILYHYTNKIFPYNNKQNNYKIGYILGLLHGDGNINYKERALNYEMCDLEPLERVQQYINDLFNYKAKIKKTKITQGLKQAYRIRFYLNYRFDYLMKYKQIDSNSYKRGYCAGFWDAEGSINENKSQVQLSFYQKKPIFLRRIKKYLTKLNIKTSKIFMSTNNGCEKFCITGNDTFKFFNVCKPAIKTKYPTWEYHYGYLKNGRKIRKVEVKNKKGRPFIHYDLTIDKHHTYVIEGNIIVHNCDLHQLAYYPNVRMFNLNKKCKGSKGVFEKVDKPLKIISDKARLGDSADNILVDKINDTEEDYDLRYFVVNLLELPEEIEKLGVDALTNLPEKEFNLDKLPAFKNVQEKFLKIYNKDKVVTPEYCYSLLEKRANKKLKEKEEKKLLKKKLKEKKNGSI